MILPIMILQKRWARISRKMMKEQNDKKRIGKTRAFRPHRHRGFWLRLRRAAHFVVVSSFLCSEGRFHLAELCINDSAPERGRVELDVVPKFVRRFPRSGERGYEFEMRINRKISS